MHIPLRGLTVALSLLAAATVLGAQAVPVTVPAEGPAPQAGTPAADPATPRPAPAPAGTTPAAQQPAFRANIDLVSLNVTVTDSTGRYITDIDEHEFLVFENGVKQDISFFARKQNPIALSMLLDSSASMENKLPTLQAAASSFVRRLKPTDVAQIVEFDGTVNVHQTFTAQHDALERAIKMLHVGGSTALHNAIYVALDELKKLPPPATDEDPRRLALVVFSDGQDTSSLISYEEVLDRAKRSETAIYTIGLRNAREQGRGFNQSEYVLRQLALETGGRAFFPNNITELSAVYGQIADELSNQYALGYSSKNTRNDGTWRRIVVQVSRPNLTSRTKQGYFAPTNR